MLSFQYGVRLTTVCVLDGVSRLQMILTGRWHLVEHLLPLRVQLPVKAVQVRCACLSDFFCCFHYSKLVVLTIIKFVPHVQPSFK